MFININENLYLYIKYYNNSKAPSYILNTMNKRIKNLFSKITNYYLSIYGARKYYIETSKKYINILTLYPNDFYNYANKNSKCNLLISKDIYDTYQIYNMLMLPETENDAIKCGYEKNNEKASRFHNVSTGGYINKKYVKKDFHKGYLEAVYDEYGELVFDGLNDGTYNLYYYKDCLHKVDVLLWIMHGVYGVNNINIYKRKKLLLIDENKLHLIYNFNN